VDLAVGRERRAVGAEEHAGVGAARALAFHSFVERAEEQMDAELARERGEAGAGDAVECLGAADLLGMRAEVVRVLGRGDELGAARGGGADQRFGLRQVALRVGGRGQLADRGEEAHLAAHPTFWHGGGAG
jgi:hypothetical protein